MDDPIQNVLLVPWVSMEWMVPSDSMIPVNIGCNFAKFGYQFLFSGIYTIFVLRKINLIMLIIDSKDCENIDKALKKYKKKFEKAKVLVQLRERQSFTKPSVKRRGEVLKAVYKQQVAAGKFEL
jgi:small subunit ribosomal protein S21